MTPCFTEIRERRPRSVTGCFDLACPYGTVVHAIEHLNVTDELRKNVQIEYYEAGHMMYVHPQSMRKFSEATAAFIDANAGGSAAAAPARRSRDTE